MSAMRLKYKKWLELHLPPGLRAGKELTAIAVGLVLSTIYSAILFVFPYDYFLGCLYADAERTRLMDPEMPYAPVMPEFWEILRPSLQLFFFLILMMIWLVYYNYRHHFRGSKSIYLMRRLPDKKELRRRCSTIPILGAAAAILMMLFLTGIYYYVYITLTPPVFL